MTRKEYDSNLLKNLDLINFWEPFDRKHPNLKVGIRAMLRDFREKEADVKLAKSEIDSVQTPIFEKPIVISYNTLNQKAALSALCEKLDGQYELISESKYFQPNQLPESYLTSQALHFKLKLLKWFFQFKNHDKKVFESRFYNFYKRLGQYRHYHRAFLASAPNIRCYIATNDHSGLSQVGFMAAKNAGIPSIYIQHAAVSNLFPPLNTTYAFLDGEDAKEKYANAGNSNTQVELYGPMKFDPYLNRPDLDTKGELVGICLGVANSDFQENLELCKTLEAENIPFCLRFHPQTTEDIQLLFQNRGWAFSQPKDENALDFIMRCHTIVSPDSSIHLEALILKRNSIYFTPSVHAIDYYDFVKNGLIPKAIHSTYEVVKALSSENDIEPYRRKAKPYHAALYTDWEGKSTERIVQRVREIAKTK